MLTPALDFRLLGPLDVCDERGSMPLGGTKQRSVLALLLLHANRVVTVDRLLDELWSGRPTASAPTALQGYVSALRRVLEPARPAGTPSELLATVPGGYVLRIDPERIDAARFERLLERGRRAQAESRPGVAARTLHEALDLWRGDALGDLADEPWASGESRRLDDLRIAALEERLDAELALGRHEETVGELKALVEQYPLRERPRAQLMLALYRSGRQADALAQYQRARGILDEELGLAPGAELQRLERSILNHDPALDVTTPWSSRRARLPQPLSSCVGRARELAELTELLRRPDVRLLTLIGTGGTGKTRLALEAGRVVEEELADGVTFVSLAAVSEPELVLPTIARALQVSESASPVLETLGVRLADMELLLLLDNFEHVADAAVALPALLAAAPHVRVLATSRSPLQVTGEQEYAVAPLGLPDRDDSLESIASADAASLFEARAQAVLPDFALSEENAATVAEICSRLDGLPLALELAAARIRHLSPQAILGRLDERFQLLVSGPKDLPDRQRTLRGAIDWSYDLLDAGEQELFRGLSVFGGAFDAATVEVVCAPAGDALESLLSLFDQSLLRRRDGPDGEPRFWMLVTVREYALERLDEGEEQRLRDRHALHMTELAKTAEPELAGPQQAAWLERLELAVDDIRSAVRWLLEHDPEAALELVNALYLLWYLHGHLTEPRAWITACLERTAPRTPGQAKAFRVLGALAEHQGDFERARELGEASLALYREQGDQGSVAACLNNLGGVAVQQADYERARGLYRESIGIKRSLGDRRGVGLTLSNLAVLETRHGHYAAGRALHEEAIPISRELGNMTSVANGLSSLAEIELVDGDPLRARPLADETLEIRRELGDRGGLADTLITLTRVTLMEGDAAAALDAAVTSLAISRETGDQEGVAGALEALGDVVAANGETALGVTFRGAASSLRLQIGAPLSPIDGVFAERMLAPARSGLGQAGFAESWEAGVALSTDKALELAEQRRPSVSPVDL